MGSPFPGRGPGRGPGPPAPPTPPKPSAGGSRPPTPGMGHWRPTAPPPRRNTTTPGRESAKGGPTARGRGEAQGSRQAPTGTGHRGRHSTRAGNHQRARKRQGQGPWHRGRGRNCGHQGAHTGRARHNGKTSTAPPPADTPRLLEAHARQNAPPHHKSGTARTAQPHAHRPPDPAQGKEGTPTQGEEATPTERVAENTAAQPTTTPSPPGDDPSRSKGHHTGNGTGTRGRRGHGRDTQDGR